MWILNGTETGEEFIVIYLLFEVYMPLKNNHSDLGGSEDSKPCTEEICI